MIFSGDNKKKRLQRFNLQVNYNQAFLTTVNPFWNYQLHDILKVLLSIHIYATSSISKDVNKYSRYCFICLLLVWKIFS